MSRKGSTSKATAEKTRESEFTANICGACGHTECSGLKFEETENWIMCDVCSKWFHTLCVGMSDEIYNFLNKAGCKGQVHWFCNVCNSISLDMLKTINDLKYRNDQFEKEIITLRSETDKKVREKLSLYDARLFELETKKKFEIDEIKRIVQRTVEENTISLKDVMQQEMHKNVEVKVKDEFQKGVTDLEESSAWTEVVKKHVDTRIGNVKEQVDQVKLSLIETRAQAVEERDKENRRNNLVLYKVPESDAVRAEDRNRADFSFCINLLNKALNVGIEEDDIINVFRLGRRGEEGTSRPLLVQLGSYTLKNLILESLYKLRHAESKFKSVVVTHDLTKIEREQCKQLVAEAKVKTSEDQSGEYLYRVRGPPGQMKIVKIKVRF